MPERVIVTGGGGLLGSHLCERLLSSGHSVVCIDDFSTSSPDNVAHLVGDARFELQRRDVNDLTAVDGALIYHLACPASPVHYQREPVRTIRTAVQGTLNMLDAARAAGARILIASTSEVYGDPGVHPQPESYWGNVNPIGPRSCYDEGKRCAEALAVAHAAQHGTQVRIARIFNTYGPRMHEQDGRVVSNFIVQALRGDPITVYGDGTQTRSFCYVNDTVEGLIRLMALSVDPGPINLGNPNEIRIGDLAALVVDLCGSSSSIERAPLPGDDPGRRCPDIAAAQSVLGWSPAVPLADGLRQTIAHFRAQ